MTNLDLVNLRELMKLTTGSPEVAVGLIDGPVAMGHPELTENIRALSGPVQGGSGASWHTACIHGTFVAGILGGRRGSPAPAICPGCTLLVRPIFGLSSEGTVAPRASAEGLAQATVDLMNAGARILNLSAAVLYPSARAEGMLNEALGAAAKRGVIVVAAAGNQGLLTSSALTRHPWVIPVVACDSHGYATQESNLGASIGKQGLRAPGSDITSLAVDGGWFVSGGTSAAAPFVTGTIALLWSQFPQAGAERMKMAVTQFLTRRPRSVVPPLLNAMAAYRSLANVQ